MNRPSKRLRMISLALSYEMDAKARLSNKTRAVNNKTLRDLNLLLDSFLLDALTLDVVSRIEGIDGLPEQHKSFALALEDRSVAWRAWHASCGVWLIGGSLNTSRSARVRGAVVHLEWIDPRGAVHRNWWCCLKVGEWIAGLGR